jgi:hypothetical protein
MRASRINVTKRRMFNNERALAEIILRKYLFDSVIYAALHSGNIRLAVAKIALRVRRHEFYGGRPRVFSSV